MCIFHFLIFIEGLMNMLSVNMPSVNGKFELLSGIVAEWQSGIEAEWPSGIVA